MHTLTTNKLLILAILAIGILKTHITIKKKGSGDNLNNSPVKLILHKACTEN